ncbi:MAG: TonB-dependent receptor domain-containing protein [Opitutales bacterium]
MKTKSLNKALLAAVSSLFCFASLSAIEIVVPDQYKDQVEAIKEAEREQRERELQGVTESSEEGAIDIASTDAASAETPLVEGADEFVVQSVVEAQETAAEFEGTLAADEGIVSGQILDQDTGEPLAGAAIIIEGTEIATVTAEDGRYSLGPIPAGLYTISFIKTGYIEANVTDYTVAGGQVSVFPFALPPRPADMSDEVYELQDFTVTAEEANEMMALIDLKQLSVGAVDFLSAEDFSKFGGSDLSDLVKKITGVTVVEGKFAVVRGLSDRYNSTLVNGLPVPSPDPLRQGVQLDLFPSSIIDNIVTNKIFLAEFPGNSGGGVFELSTRAFPDEFFAEAKVGLRYNDNWDGFLRSPYSESDHVNPFASPGRPDNLTEPDSGFNEVTSPIVLGGAEERDPMPAGSLQVSFGDRYETGSNFLSNFRFVVSTTYDSNSSNKSGGTYAERSVSSNPQASPRFVPPFGFAGNFPPGSEPNLPGISPEDLSSEYRPGSLYDPTNGDTIKAVEYDYQQSESNSLFGYLLGGQFGFGPEEEHKISLVRLFSESRVDRVNRFSDGHVRIDGDTNPFSIIGDPSTDGSLFREDSQARLAEFRNSGTILPPSYVAGEDTVEYEERTLEANQIFGNHDLSELTGYETWLSWGLSDSEVTSVIPLRTEFDYYQALVDTVDSGRVLGAGDFYVDSANAQGNPAYLLMSSQSIEHESDAKRVDFEHKMPAFWVDRDVAFTGGYFTETIEREVSGKNAEVITALDGPNQVGSNPGALAQNISNLPQTGGGTPVTNDDTFLLNGEIYESGASVSREVESVYLQTSVPISDKIQLTLGSRFVNMELEASGNAELAGSNGQDGFSLGDLLSGTYPTVDGPLSNAEILGYPEIPTGDASGLLERDVALPSIVLQVDITDDLTLRAGYTKTEAYPSFREFSPYFDYEASAGEIILGNPNLTQSEVTSYDLRVDYTLPNNGYISFSIFSKEIENSIEKIKLLGGFRYEFTSYINNENKGTLQGIEIEGRSGLDFVDSWLGSDEIFSNVSVGFNATLIDSEIDRPRNIVSTYTSAVPLNDGSGDFYFISPFLDENGQLDLPGARGLYDQPEWILNADVTVEFPTETTATLYLYGQSQVLTAVGSGRAENNALSLLDEYTDSYFELGLNIKQKISDNFSISLRVNNLTDSVRRVIYDPDIVDDEKYSYRKGRSFSISGSYTF